MLDIIALSIILLSVIILVWSLITNKKESSSSKKKQAKGRNLVLPVNSLSHSKSHYSGSGIAGTVILLLVLML